MTSLVRLYFRKDLYSIVMWTLIIFVFPLSAMLIQAAGRGPIHVQFIGVGMFVGIAFAIVAFGRGKHGEGRVISRIPLPRWQIFLSLYVYGALAALLFLVLFSFSAEAARMLFTVMGYDVTGVHYLVMGSLSGEFQTLMFNYAAVALVICLIRFLERWMTRDRALLIIVVLPIILMLVLPFFFVNVQVQWARLLDVFVPLVTWIAEHPETSKVLILGSMVLAAMGLFRVRHFKNFG